MSSARTPLVTGPSCLYWFGIKDTRSRSTRRGLMFIPWDLDLETAFRRFEENKDRWPGFQIQHEPNAQGGFACVKWQAFSENAVALLQRYGSADVLPAKKAQELLDLITAKNAQRLDNNLWDDIDSLADLAIIPQPKVKATRYTRSASSHDRERDYRATAAE